jgi:hypothetical protein
VIEQPSFSYVTNMASPEQAKSKVDLMNNGDGKYKGKTIRFSVDRLKYVR